MGERDEAPELRKLVDLMKGLMQAARPSEGALALLQRLELTLPQILSMTRMRHGPQTVSALAAELRLTPGAVSRLIDQLVAKGLVRRMEGEPDRRCKILTLSPAGLRALAQLDGARDADLVNVLERLAPELRAELEGVLGRVAAAVGESRRGAGRLKAGPSTSSGCHPPKENAP